MSKSLPFKGSIKDGFGIWRFSDGRMDMGKYELNSEGRLEEIKVEETNLWVEDSMTSDEWMEYQYEKHSQEQRDKYGESDRDEEERRLNEHMDAREEG